MLTVPLSMIIGLALAVLMNSVLPGRKVARTIIYLPLVISGVSVGLIGTYFFNETIGVMNLLFGSLGCPDVSWQSEGGAGLRVAGADHAVDPGGLHHDHLSGRPAGACRSSCRRPAQVEGATAWQRFRHITVPLLGPSTFFLLVMNVIYSFQVFDTVYVLTKGGPGSATEVLGTYAYKTAFGSSRDQGYGAAIGVVIFALTLVFTILQWRTNRRRDEVA